ncbi:Clavaminate synthase-like protein [Flammula alnicola]|nr:Clavaminate synthase-like protein [Flammula alnicola]
MPGLVAPETPHYVPAPGTQADLEYADLPIIDLAEAGTSEGRLALAQQARDAMVNHGFFYVINHGYTPAQTQRIFDIADVPFARVSDEEKQTYVATMKQTGSYQGYKPRQYWHIANGVRDQLEHYNLNRDITKRQHPEPLRPFLPEIEAFARHNHEDVRTLPDACSHTLIMDVLCRLLALGLELPEETLVNLHGYSSVGETYVRFMKYYPRTKDEELKTKNVWLKGHTDFGTITVLYSQPVAALQILTKEGSWEWVKHIENALVINAGDALEFLSGGFYRATIHRVIQPPPDQQSYTRLGVFYFAMTDDNVTLAPLLESPVLQRVGITKSLDGAEPPTMEAWRKGRTAAYGQSDLKPTEKGVEEEVINGVVVKHYN